MDVTIEPFVDGDLDGVLALCASEQWPTFPEDPARALRALTAPGVTTMVARGEEGLVGFAQLLSDGEIQAYLAAVVIAPSARRSGVGRAIIEAALARAGGFRIDLLSDEPATGFYDRLAHRKKPGYRLYPPLDEPLPSGASLPAPGSDTPMP